MKFPLKLVPDNTNIRFLRLRFWAMGFSLSLIALSVVLVITQSFNFGVDFVGGQMIRVTFAQPANLDTLRSRIGALGLGDAQIQEFGSPKDVSIRLRLPGGDEASANASASRVKAAIVSVDASAKFQAVETVSGKVSNELLRTGAISLILAMIGISLYIWFRFEWQFGVGALFALFHDVALTLGFFALTRLEFNLNVVAAVLTIIGYSLNDTIIVYDRIRENMKKYRKMEMVALLDLSVNETLSRTIVTSLSLIMTLTILLIMGPEVIFGFTAAMLLGIFVGTFSSIYVGAPILIWLKVKSDSFLPKEARADNAERVTRRDEGTI